MNSALMAVIDQIRLLSSEDQRLVAQEIALLLAGIEPTEAQSCEDLVPIDVPIEGHKISETGVLRIRFPFQIGRRDLLGWRTMVVTQAAQLRLLEILAVSLDQDEKAGRIPPTPAARQ